MFLCLERLPFPPPRTIKGKRSIAKQEEKLLYHKASLASQGKDANYPSLKPWGVVTSLCTILDQLPHSVQRNLYKVQRSTVQDSRTKI